MAYLDSRSDQNWSIYRIQSYTVCLHLTSADIIQY